MPHISYPLLDNFLVNFLLNPGTAVSPIIGNSEQGGAAYDPGTDQALYATYHNGAMRCFRTTEGYPQLVLNDGSVTEVGVILNATLERQRSVGLTVIAGTLYALVVGSDAANNRAGTWVYRDTSGTSGAGPWVLHGTVSEALPSDTTGGAYPEMVQPTLNYGGEILVLESGRWICAPTFMSVVDVSGTMRLKGESGIAYSDDGGATWFPAFYFTQGGAGFTVTTRDSVPEYRAVAVFGGSRSFGVHDGTVYAGFRSNTGSEVHTYSTNGQTWTRYEIGVGGNAVYVHPFSVGDTIYRELTGDLSETTGAPETNPAYTFLFDMEAVGLPTDPDTVPAACVIGPEAAPLVAMTKLGKIVGIGTVMLNGLDVGIKHF